MLSFILMNEQVYLSWSVSCYVKIIINKLAEVLIYLYLGNVYGIKLDDPQSGNEGNITCRLTLSFTSLTTFQTWLVS